MEHDLIFGEDVLLLHELTGWSNNDIYTFILAGYSMVIQLLEQQLENRVILGMCPFFSSFLRDACTGAWGDVWESDLVVGQR